MNKYLAILLIGYCLPMVSCAQHADASGSKTFKEMNRSPKNGTQAMKDTATFAAGCFWCVEAQFKELNGVSNVSSGYTGGTVAHPSYKAVCSGTTGHAEACNIIYDPSVVSYDELLAAFFTAHDPTQLNRQGNDVGTQYRSAIFYHNGTQKKLAEYYIGRLNAEKAFTQPVVTTVGPYSTFYKAENYHQDYYALNGAEPYCRMIIAPKVDNFKKVFRDKLK